MKNQLFLLGLLLVWLVSACSTVPPVPGPAQSPTADVTRTAPDGQPILQIDSGGHMALIRDIFFTHDGKTLISASDDKTVRVWDLASGKTVRILRGQIGPGAEGKIYAATLSPDNQLLALGGWLNPECTNQCGHIRLIDLANGQVLRLLKGHTDVILGLAFSADGRFLLSGSADNTARIWDVGSGENLHTLVGHQNHIYAVAFSPDGSKVITGSDDDNLKLWTSSTGKLLSNLKGHSDDVASVAFTPDGRYILSGSWDRTIRLWQSTDGKFIKVMTKLDSTVSSLSVTVDGEKVVTGFADAIDTINVFSIPDGKRLAQFSEHQDIVLATAISPNTATAATAGFEGEIYLWDLQTGQTKQRLAGKGQQIWSVAFARDGRSIAWGKVKNNINLFERGKLEHSFQLRNQQGNFSLTLDDSSFATSKLAVWHYLRAIDSASNLSIGTPNNQTSSDLFIRKNNQVVHIITRDSTLGFDHRSITLTPDSRTVVSGSMNGTLASYNPTTGQKIRNFVGHTSDVWAVAPSPDGRLLVSGSADQTVRL